MPTAEGPGPDGLGAYHENAMVLARGADLLIHDSQHTPEEFPARADRGHCSWEYPVHLAEHARASRVLVFHHDPGHDDAFLDAMAAGLPHHVTLAVEGTMIAVTDSVAVTSLRRVSVLQPGVGVEDQ